MTLVLWPSLGQKGPHLLQIGLGIHPDRRRFKGLGDVDLLPVPEHPQLLQCLDLLQHARCPVYVTLDKAGAIGVDADMALVVVANLLVTVGKTISIPGMLARLK